MVYKSSTGGGAGGGVSSLNGETGNVTLTSSGGSVQITTPTASTVNLEVLSGGTGTVTNVAGTDANGVAFSISNPTTTPNITIALGTITPTSVTSNVGVFGSLTVTSTIVGSVNGNAGTATALATARAINGVNFDGTAAITVPAAAASLTGTTIGSTVVTSSLTTVGTLVNLTVTNPITGSVSGSSGSTSGNAATATALQTARAINGVNFDGTAAITVPAAAASLTGTTLGSIVVTSSLTSFGPSIALGTPASGIATNLSGTALALNAGSAPAATLTGTTIGSTVVVSSLTKVGTLGSLTVTSTIVGSINGNAATVTTNANLTGPITSSGNATAIAAQTGTGTTFVMQSSPTITTAVLGSSTATTQAPADNSTKLATTAYVDAAVLGQNFKEAAKYATTAALATVVYANGSSGVGATLTAVGVGALSLDGSTPSVNDRILVKNQASTFQNGIYTVTVVGTGATVFVLTRALDANQTSEYRTGDSLFVTSGTVNGSTTWAYTGIDSPTMGTDALTYVQTAGQGTVTSGNGITVTGLSVAIDTSVTVDKTTAQTLTNKTLTSPILTTPSLGVATATSIAIGGATLGSNAFSVTGTASFSSTVSTTQLIAGVATGTPPLVVNSTTQVANLNAATSGNATTATALATPRAINGVNFDGTADITIPAAAATLTGTTIGSAVVVSSLTKLGTLGSLTVTSTIVGSVNGNAGTATALATARAINGVNFDGTAAITVPAAAASLTGTTIGSTVVTSSLTTVGTIGTGVWNGTAVDATHGGTNQTTWTTGDLLYASAANTLSKLTIGGSTQVLTVTGNIPAWSAATGGLTWNNVTSTSQAMSLNIGYIANNAALCTLTLPASSAVGKVVAVQGAGSGGWLLAQNSGQTVFFGNQSTTAGVGGSVASVNRRDAISLICTATDTDWTVNNSLGNLTVV